jgi:hypothetical protein
VTVLGTVVTSSVNYRTEGMQRELVMSVLKLKTIILYLTTNKRMKEITNVDNAITETKCSYFIPNLAVKYKQCLTIVKIFYDIFDSVKVF